MTFIWYLVDEVDIVDYCQIPADGTIAHLLSLIAINDSSGADTFVFYIASLRSYRAPKTAGDSMASKNLTHYKRTRFMPRIILDKRMASRDCFSAIEFIASSSFASDNDMLLVDSNELYIPRIIIVQWPTNCSTPLHLMLQEWRSYVF